MEKIIVFIDILGFKNIVKEWEIDKRIAQKLEDAFKRSIEWLGGVEALSKPEMDDWNLRIFSDSLIIFQSLNEYNLYTTLKGISYLMRELLNEGFLVRGSITIGEYEETLFTTFSPGLVEAYYLESNIAKYPRVILSEKVLKEIELIVDAEIRRTIKEYLIKDRDNLVFLCYFIFEEDDPWFSDEKFYRLHKNIIEKNIKLSVGQADVQEKFRWLAKFHNWTIAVTSIVYFKAQILTEENTIDFKSLMIKKVTDYKFFESVMWSETNYNLKKVKRMIDVDDVTACWPLDKFDEDGDDHDLHNGHTVGEPWE